MYATICPSSLVVPWQLIVEINAAHVLIEVFNRGGLPWISDRGHIMRWQKMNKSFVFEKCKLDAWVKLIKPFNFTASKLQPLKVFRKAFSIWTYSPTCICSITKKILNNVNSCEKSVKIYTVISKKVLITQFLNDIVAYSKSRRVCMFFQCLRQNQGQTRFYSHTIPSI